MTLYELTADFTRYMEAEDDDGIGSALAEITAGQIEQKAENWCHFLANIEGQIDHFRAEERRIAAARKIMENKVERGREYIKAAMLDADIDKINAGTFKLSLAKTAGSTVIYDADIIPAQFLTYVPATTIPDKAAIKDAIKHGEHVPGARVEEGFSLRIK